MLLSLHILTNLLLAVIKLICLLVAIAYFTLAERKIMAAVQRRVGPNVVGLIGLLQPLADGLKLAGKEAVVPSQASGRIFMAAAMAVLLFALSGWSTIPFGLFDHSETMSTGALVSSLLEYDVFGSEKWYVPPLDADFMSALEDYCARLSSGKVTPPPVPPKEGYYSIIVQAR